MADAPKTAQCAHDNDGHRTDSPDDMVVHCIVLPKWQTPLIVDNIASHLDLGDFNRLMLVNHALNFCRTNSRVWAQVLVNTFDRKALLKAVSRVFLAPNRTEIVRILLDGGFDQHLEFMYYDLKPLEVAIENGLTDVAKLLVERGAETDRDGGALEHAVFKGDIDLVRFLIDRGCDIHANNDNAIVTAAYLGKPDFFRYLLEIGLDIRTHGGNCLRCAASSGFMDIVRLCLDRGCTSCINDSFLLAIKNRHTDIAMLLI